MPDISRRPTARPGSGTAAFAAVAAIFVLFTAASSAPSPLYVVYQEAWGFSSATLTVVFAVYVLGMLGALLVVGALSDHVGRRPVVAGAIALEAVSLGLFLAADHVSVLLLARLLQGIATGAAMTTLGAALVDLDPPHAPGRAGALSSVIPLTGLAVGALGTGALVEYAPAPTRLVYGLLLGGMALSAVVLLFLPETSARRPGALRSLAPRLGVPHAIRPDLYTLLPILIASWALAGLYLSLGPSVAAGLLGLRSHLIGGLVVTLLCGTGAAAALLLRGRPTAGLLDSSAALLAGGTVVSLVGIETGTVALAAVGTVVAGVGFGGAGLACFGTLARLAAPAQRGELFAVVFVIAYLAFSLPAVIAGFAATSAGLRPTALAYGLTVVALGALALAAQRLRARQTARRAACPQAAV
ncbi:MFS transporter [Streptomyces hainanensis]|uniref:MFS transporter n=1 Tax=Streptomyces hainanensis TaxID=402648 RepID=A0A4R4TLY9_9ACTN|nr:MFS transporter [Streptomyces hainanensis]TDC79078.1 MFS transporter [Streptomyces hainanensis]